MSERRRVSESDIAELVSLGMWPEDRVRMVVDRLCQHESTAQAGCLRRISDLYDYMPVWAAAEVALELLDEEE